MMRKLLPLVFMTLAACAPGTIGELPTRSASPALDRLPPMKTFGQPIVRAPARSNVEIARDFMDLSFEMESGRKLDILTRFEGPITLRVLGRPPVSLAPDLGRLLTRLRNEAGLNIEITQDPAANINIVSLPKRKMQKIVPQAACFVVPNVRDWDDFRKSRRSARVDWVRLGRREQIAVFVPNDASPQELRDCLHEEIAQALGPLNDLYRLPDSVFNDDNIHTVLTGFDMLILRAYYDPALRNGMTRAQVAAVLPGILDRINPAGRSRSGSAVAKTDRAWKDQMQTALGSGAGNAARRNAAQRAVDLAAIRGWQGARPGFAQYALGRLSIVNDPDRARRAFENAAIHYRADDQTAIHGAYVAVQLAAFALLNGEAQQVLDIVTPNLRVAAQHENAAVLASLLMFRAEALELIGRGSEARSVRLDSLGWARYGFGSDAAVRARLREISALNPAKQGQV